MEKEQQRTTRKRPRSAWDVVPSEEEVGWLVGPLVFVFSDWIFKDENVEFWSSWQLGLLFRIMKVAGCIFFSCVG